MQKERRRRNPASAGAGVVVLCGLFWAVPAEAQRVVKYPHLDAVGNVRAVTDASGNVIERHDYLPFGEEWCPGPPPGVCANVPPGQPKRFTGKERDAETGLDYFGARYYGSKIGRFTTVDPVYTWRENLVDPQRWNRYVYVRNNPLRYVDPDGRCTAPAGVGGGVGFCVEAFISSPGIGPLGDVLGPGAGDNRTFSATDGSLSYRARVQFVVDPMSGEISNFDAQAGTSTAFGGTLSGGGSIHANITNKKRTDEGDTTFTLNILALNGLAGVPAAPKDPIDINLNFVLTNQGKVGLGPGSNQTGYPSVGAYSYTNGGRKAKTIHERQEGKPSDLSAHKVQLPERKPQ